MTGDALGLLSMPMDNRLPTVAIVFPGQGSQRRGMGWDLMENFQVAREVYERASEALGFDVGALCVEDDPRLDETEFTQPALLATEIAMLRVWEQRSGAAPRLFGGHSLGEYTALCAAGVISLEDAVRIVRRRGALMQAAVPLGRGTMLAIVSQGITARAVAGDFRDLGVDVANFNSADQIVLSGESSAIAAAAARAALLLKGVAHDIVPLNVSAPFHSRAMRTIEGYLRASLADIAPRLTPLRAPVVLSNLTGCFHEPRTNALVHALTLQASHPVRWVDNMSSLIDAADVIYEIGPSRPLRRFFATMGRDIISLTTARSLAHARLP